MEKQYACFMDQLCRELEHRKESGESARFFRVTGKEEEMLVLECKDAEGKAAFAVRLEPLYRQYLQGAAIEKIAQDILDSLSGECLDDILCVSDCMEHYDKIRSRLFVRALNEKRYREKLPDMIYDRIGDIILALYIQVSSTSECFTSSRVQKRVFARWNREKKEVMQDALQNTLRMAPPRLYSWEKLLTMPAYKGEDFMDPSGKGELSRDAYGNCISTSRRVNGAVCVFLPGIAKYIAGILNDDLYCAFTSIHEVMVHARETVATADLREVLKDTILETTPSEDILSYHIYRYDRESDSFSMEL